MKHTWMIVIGLGFTLIALGQKSDSPEVLLGSGLHQEEVEGNCREAIKVYQKVLQQKNAARNVAARAQLHIGSCQEKLGQSEARAAYETVLTRYADQAEMASEARSRIATLGGESTANAVRVRRLLNTSHSQGEAPGLWVPLDGRLLPYSKSGELSVFDTSTSQSRRVLDPPKGSSEGIGAAVVSPDGKSIAYEHSDFNLQGEIRIVNIDGSQDRLLFRNPDPKSRRAWPADWSTDGKQLAIRVNVGTAEGTSEARILLISMPGGASRLLYASKPPINGPARFSPDGRYLAFGDTRDVFIIPTAGGTPVAVVDHPANDILVGWAPDGRLVFSSDRSGVNDIWAVRIQDGKPAGMPEVVRKDLGRAALMGLTRDGSLFYTLTTPSADIFTAELNASGRVASGPAAIAGRFVGANVMPDYSPDGKLLAYVSGLPESTSSTIRIRSLDSGTEREIPKPFPDVRQLRWYPDGKALLLFGRDVEAAGPGLYRLDVQTGLKSVVLGGGVTAAAAANPTFSPDGKYLYYESDSIERVSPALMRMDLASGQKQEVFRPATGYLRLYALSPDGSQIVFNWRKETQDLLYLMGATGGDPKLLYEYPKNEYSRAWGGIGWMADGKAVFYHHVLDFGQQDELLRISLSGGGAEKVLTTGVIRRIAVHPDGRRIAWEARTQSTEFFVMENLFPKPRR